MLSVKQENSSPSAQSLNFFYTYKFCDAGFPPCFKRVQEKINQSKGKLRMILIKIDLSRNEGPG